MAVGSGYGNDPSRRMRHPAEGVTMPGVDFYPESDLAPSAPSIRPVALALSEQARELDELERVIYEMEELLYSCLLPEQKLNSAQMEPSRGEDSPQSELVSIITAHTNNIMRIRQGLSVLMNRVQL